MKTFLITLISIIFLSAPILCQEMPGDVPEDHYAYDAINDLLERGVNVSQGYPDGLFHGNKKTSRYETAYLMAKVALSLKETVSTEIDVSDIKEEIEWLRGEIIKLNEQPGGENDLKYYGSLELNSKFGNIMAYDQDHRNPNGPEAGYRLKYSIEKLLGNDATLKMNLDTMDGGFRSNSQRAFPKGLIDVEAALTADLGMENPVKITAMVGPGSVPHRDTSGVCPSDDYMFYSRPRPSFVLNTMMGPNDVSFAYAARGVASNGQVGTSEVYLQLDRKLGHFPLIGTAESTATSRYVFIDIMNPASEQNNFRQELSFRTTQNDNLSEKLMFGAASSDSPKSQFYLNLELYLKNIYGKGTDVNFKFNSVGTDYRLPFEDLEFVPLNLFNKKILDGTVDMGLEIIRPFAGRFVFISRSEWVGNSSWKMAGDIPGSSFTQELSLDYSIRRDFILNSFYRYYHVPSKIGQFNVPVPEFSDIFGIGLTYRF